MAILPVNVPAGNAAQPSPALPYVGLTLSTVAANGAFSCVPLTAASRPTTGAPGPLTTIGNVTGPPVWVDAATVVVHGSWWLTEPGTGTGTEALVLPAAAATKMPASSAARNACEFESCHGDWPPLIEKLMTSMMPSAIAWSTAPSIEEPGQ